MTQPLVYNLIPGQYQIGSLVFGRGTTVPVETFEIKPTDINAQDYQVSRSDEQRFGWDQLKPTTITITFDVLINRLLPPYEDLIPGFWDEMPKVRDFQREWRSDDIRQVWGAMKPLYVCGNDSITREIFGRCGQFTYAKNSQYTEVIQCLAEFRRADTLSYTAQEEGEIVLLGDTPTYITAGGDSPTWFRILAEGPMTHPIFTIGTQTVELDLTLAAGEVLEISSYPWNRRIVDSNRVNHSADMIGDTQYLDRLKLPCGVPVPVRWTSTEANTWVPALGSQSWQEDIDSTKFYTLPTTFTVLGGKVVVGVAAGEFISDLIGEIPQVVGTGLGNVINTVSDAGKFIHNGFLSTTSAIIYNAKQFATANQHSEAKVVHQFLGASAIVIMSNATMTNYVALEHSSDPVDGNWIRIITGSNYHTYDTARASYHNTNPLGWLESDRIAIESELDTGTGHVTYTGYLNGTAVVTWTDTGNVVSSANRYQGFIFDMNGNLGSVGTGFRDIFNYDTLVLPSQTGTVAILWQDAWSIVE